MKNLFSLLVVAFLSIGIVGISVAGTESNPDENDAIEALQASARSANSKVDWTQFSTNLVEALQSSHDGLQQAAMRLVIRHGDNLDVAAAVFDVMRIYRNGDKENLRRMAVVTLANMNSDWALEFLKRSVRFERSKNIRKTIQAVLAESNIA